MDFSTDTLGIGATTNLHVADRAAEVHTNLQQRTTQLVVVHKLNEPVPMLAIWARRIYWLTPSLTKLEPLNRPPRTLGQVVVNDTGTFGSLTESSDPPGRASCHSDRAKSSGHWVGARGFPTDPTPQTAALLSQSPPCPVPFLGHHAVRGPGLLTSHPLVHSLLIRLWCATRRQARRGRTHNPQSPPVPRTQLLTTPPRLGSTLRSDVTPVSVASLTSFPPRAQLT